MARETHLEAMESAMFAGRLGGEPSVREVAGAARATPVAPQPPRAIDLLLDGLATRFTDGYTAAMPTLRTALDAFRADEEPSVRDVRWLWLACRVAQDLWDDETWYVLATRGLRVARETGALRVLPTAATYRAALHVHAGAFGAASSLIEETDAIIRATGTAPVKYARVWLTAWRGEEAEGVAYFDAITPEGMASGEGMAFGVLWCGTALLYNGNGRYAEALAAARRACEHEDVGPFGWSLAELIEAGVRCDETAAASAALDRLSERTQASGTDWALGIEAGSRALLTDGERAEPLYREAIERLARSRGVVHLARAELLYGEWLRRENRRADAREQLRAAYDRFDQIGAEAFAERARRELLATGETAPRRTVETRDVLTPQEAQIARMASDRQTNPEIGATLFISPRTVEYHLRKVFTKLDISSRKQLRGALAGMSGAGGVTTRWRSPKGAGRISRPFSLLKRGELGLEASHRVAVQEGSPAHPGHAQRGQLGERRRLRQAYDVHRAAHLRGEAAQRVRLPQGDRVHAVDAGLEVGIRPSQRFGNELLLGPGAGTGEHGTEEDVHPGVDHERVAVRRRGLANRAEPLRVPVRIAEAADGVVAVLEIAAGGPGAPQRSDQLGGLHPVAGLGVDRHGHLDAPGDPRGRGEHLVGRRTLMVLIAERRGHATAGGRDHGKPGRDHGSRRSHVPGVRKQKRGAGALQRPQQVAPALEVGCL
jgi:DNA-binding CsgD family transcriptional regulator